MNGAVVAETIRSHVTSIGYLIFLLLVVAAGMVAATFNAPAALWPSLVSLLAIITGAAIIGPEFSTGTLQLIVSKPIRRPVYLISRVAGVFVSVSVAAIAGFVAEVLVRTLLPRATMPWTRLLLSLANTLALALLTISLLTLFGSLTRAYFNAAIYIGGQAVLAVALAFLGIMRVRGPVSGFLQHVPVERAVMAIDEVFFPSPPAQSSALWLLRIVLTAAVAIALACAAFSRREVPYGAE